MPPAYRRLSASPLWRAQRRFYRTGGVDPWRTGTIPHHVTNSVALAEAWAQVVSGFARDARAREPLHVVELGAGSGRFAFLFLKALERLGPAAPPVRYVMTDVGAATIEFWSHHPAFVPFLRARRLDFAQFDAVRDTSLTLLVERAEIAATAPVERLVVIANYVFSGLPQDAFLSRGGRLQEWLIHTATARRRPDTMALKGRPGVRTASPYDDALFNQVLRERSGPGGVRLFPAGTLRCLQRVTALATHDTLVLVADRPDPSAGLDTRALGMGRHGAVSFPVDLAALRTWTRRQGGDVLGSRRPAQHLATTALLLGCRPGGWRRTRSTWRRVMARGGPDALYHRRRRLASIRRPTLRALFDLMRASGPDPRVLAESLRPLWPHLVSASPALRARLHDIAVDAWRNHYDVGEPHDLAFDLGLLLYGVQSWDDARGLFEASLRSHGADAATHWNLGLCHLALGEADAARKAFREARERAPGLNAAGPVTVKLETS